MSRLDVSSEGATLLSDGERLTGAYALGPEAGEWLQLATLAIRAHISLDVLTDTIQPFPTFSGDLRRRAEDALRRDRRSVQGGRRGTADGELMEGEANLALETDGGQQHVVARPAG